MANLILSSSSPSTLDTDVLVVAAHRVPGGIRLAHPDALPPDLGAHLTAVLPTMGFTGKTGEVARVPSAGLAKAPTIAAVGLGDADDDASHPPASPPLEPLRQAAGAAVRRLAGCDRVALAFGADTVQAIGAVGEGALLGAYAFTRYRTEAGPLPPTEITLATPLAGSKAARKAADRAAIVARMVAETRDLVNTAPNDLPPATMADAVRTRAKAAGVKVTVLDAADLADGGYGGILAVGQGSTRPPRLVKLVWSGAKATAHVALVGKGITFDSGGLSLKPAAGMTTMKSDMAGAAAVAGAVIAAAKLKLPVKVTGWLALAENMPSGSAGRPGDVIAILGGTTVEVLNTDAEGRLVLADALVAAGRETPDVIVDIATLTGSQVVALGPRMAGVMGTDSARAEVLAAAEASGEPMWPMPLPKDLRSSLDSPMADLANIGGRDGGMLVAGLFLREFTGGREWAHVDIAGPAFWNGEAADYTPRGATGYGVRTLVALLEARAGR
ncbi:MAG: leucyl aminopeptidase [Bifidobacteriaceae bacterium]|nr:leucyl aminopeptidase [Bifidobacteriaceae bacterium]